MGAPNGPAAARAGSTWIHWWSPVASANSSMRSCSMVTHSVGSSSAPMWSRRPAGVGTWRVILPRRSGLGGGRDLVEQGEHRVVVGGLAGRGAFLQDLVELLVLLGARSDR